MKTQNKEKEDPEGTTISVSKDMANKLNMMKYSLGLKTTNQVIEKLITIANKIKTGEQHK